MAESCLTSVLKRDRFPPAESSAAKFLEIVVVLWVSVWD
jgi:hypothetical protein